MARKTVFTDEAVIEASNLLNEQGKHINGTNLRLAVGSGSPKKLLETYNNLLAKGKVRNKFASEIEALEVQLESALEEVASLEEKVSVLEEELDILKKVFIESCQYHQPINPDVNQFSDIYDYYLKVIGESNLDPLNSLVSSLGHFLIDMERSMSESNYYHLDDEMRGLYKELSEKIYARKSSDLLSAESTEEELALDNLIRERYKERYKDSKISKKIEELKNRNNK